MKATRAYIAGFGTAGSLLAGAAILFVLASAIVSFRGWPSVADQGQPIAVVPARAPTGSSAVKHIAAIAAAQARAFTPTRHIVAAHTAPVAPPAPAHHAAPAPVHHTSVVPTTVIHSRPARIGSVTAPPSAPAHPTQCSTAASCGIKKVTTTLGSVTSQATGGLGQTVANTGGTLGTVVGNVTSSLGSTLGTVSPGLGKTVATVGAGLAGTLTAVTGTTGGLGGVLMKAGQLLGHSLDNGGATLGALLDGASASEPGAQAGATGATGATGITAPAGVS